MAKKWIKLWIQPIRESMKILNMTPSQFGIWIWILLFTAKYGDEDGAFYFGDIPVSLPEFYRNVTTWLPVCDRNVTRWSEKVAKWLDYLFAHDHLVKDKNGVIKVKNWKKYQVKYMRLPNGHKTVSFITPVRSKEVKKLRSKEVKKAFLLLKEQCESGELKSKFVYSWNGNFLPMRYKKRQSKWFVIGAAGGKEWTEFAGDWGDVKWGE